MHITAKMIIHPTKSFSAHSRARVARLISQETKFFNPFRHILRQVIAQFFNSVDYMLNLSKRYHPENIVSTIIKIQIYISCHTSPILQRFVISTEIIGHRYAFQPPGRLYYCRVNFCLIDISQSCTKRTKIVQAKASKYFMLSQTE